MSGSAPHHQAFPAGFQPANHAVCICCHACARASERARERESERASGHASACMCDACARACVCACVLCAACARAFAPVLAHRKAQQLGVARRPSVCPSRKTRAADRSRHVRSPVYACMHAHARVRVCMPAGSWQSRTSSRAPSRGMPPSHPSPRSTHYPPSHAAHTYVCKRTCMWTSAAAPCVCVCAVVRHTCSTFISYCSAAREIVPACPMISSTYLQTICCMPVCMRVPVCAHACTCACVYVRVCVWVWV